MQVINLLKSLRWEVAGLILVGAAIFLDPTRIYPVFEFNAPDERLFLSTNGFVTAAFLTYLGCVMLCTALFGYTLLLRFWRHIGAGSLISLCASFWAGYIGAVGLFRVFSLYLRPELATQSAGVAMLCIMAYSFAKDGACVLVSIPRPPQIRRGLLIIMAAVLLFYLFLGLQVYAGDFLWVGHGPKQYLYIVTDYLRNGGDATIPVIPQHVDEVLYTAFFLAPIDFRFDPILVATVALAFNKVSTGIFIYCALRALGASRLISVTGSAFLLFATFGINPFIYLMYFDSSNPVAYIVHSGRTVGIPLAIYLVTLSLLSVRGSLILWSPVSLAILSFGIATTSISNFIFATFVLLVGFFVRISTTKAPETSNSRALIATILIFLGPCLAYFPAFLGPTPLIRPGITFLLTIFGARLLLYPYARTYYSKCPQIMRQTERRALAIWIASGSICLIFFANIFSDNSLNQALLRQLREWTGIDSLNISYPFISIMGDRPILDISIFVDAREHGPWKQYSVTSLHFLYQYGLMPILLLLMMKWSKRFKTPVSTTILLWASLCFILVFMLFLYIDFINDMPRSWPKTRFLEQPLYVFFFLFFAALAAHKDRLVVSFYVAMAFAWAVIPFLTTDRPLQWQVNIQYLIDLLTSKLGNPPNFHRL